MSKCYTIEIVSVVDVPVNLLINDRVYLDTLPQLEGPIIEEFDQIELDEENNNIIDGVLSFEIPYSPINDVVCRAKTDAHITDQKFTNYEIICTCKGEILEYRYLTVESKSDKNQTYTVTLTARNNHPLLLANNLPISDITYNTFILNKANIEAQWDKWTYEDGDDGFFWGFAYYGKLFYGDRFEAIDMRPMYSPLHMLREGFLNLGWKFESPILESNKFRRTWMYLSDNKYGNNSQAALDRYKFLVKMTEDTVWDGTQYSNTAPRAVTLVEEFDNNNSFLFNSIYYVPPSIYDMEFTLEYEIDVSNVTNRNQQFHLDIKQFSPNNFIFNTQEGGVTSLIDNILTFDLSVDEDNVYKGSHTGRMTKNPLNFGITGVWPTITGIDGMIIKKFRFYNRPIRQTYFENMAINMSQPLSTDIELGDVLKGVQHIVGGIFSIDWANNTITLDLPFDASPFSIDDLGVPTAENINGYLKDGQSQEITQNIVQKTQELTVPDKETERYKVYGFKKTTDAYIKSISDYDKDTMPYDKKVDLGEEFTEETKELRNPLFEPTLLGELIPPAVSVPVHLPFLVDNFGEDEPRHSYDIGPRIFQAIPATQQTYYDDEGNSKGVAKLRWYDEELTEYPIFYHSIVENNFVLATTTDYFVYGDIAGDFWSLFLARQKLSTLLSQVIQFDTYFNVSDYDLLNRDLSTIVKYNGEYIVGFIQAQTQNRCTGFGTLTLRIPIESAVANDGSLVDIISTDPCLQNNPKIVFSQVPGTDTFTLGGNNNSVVSSVDFYKRDADANDEFTGAFVSIPNATAISADVSPVPTVRYQIKMEVDYDDDCPTLTEMYTVNTCLNMTDPVIQDVFDVIKKKNAARINLNNSIFNGTISTITCQVKIDGMAPQAYVIDTVTLVGPYLVVDDQITPNFEISTLDITFTDGCSYSLQNTISKTVKNLEKNAGKIVSGELSYTDVDPIAGGRYIPDIGQIFLSKQPESVIIQYKNDNTTEYGETWDRIGTGPVGDNACFKAIFLFDNGDMDSTDWVVCQ